MRRLSPFLTGGNISPSVNCHQGVWYAVLVSTELHHLLIQTYKRLARPVKASFQDSRGEERNEFCLFTILVVVTPPLVKVNITGQTQPGWRWREKTKYKYQHTVRYHPPSTNTRIVSKSIIQCSSLVLARCFWSTLSLAGWCSVVWSRTGSVARENEDHMAPTPRLS